MKLTDTQLVLLSAASQREDGAIELAPNLKGGAAHKVVGKLLTEGLVEEIPARGALPVWRRDDEQGALALRITPCGLAAIGVDEGGTPPQAKEPRDTEQGADPAPDKSSRRVTAARRKKTRNEVPQRSATPSRRDSKQARVIAKLHAAARCGAGLGCRSAGRHSPSATAPTASRGTRDEPVSVTCRTGLRHA